MNISDRLDWSLVQVLLAVAEAGSLSGAARVLGLSQPTLGRQVQAAEQALGLSIFRRHARGLELTEAGAALIAPARAMREAAARLQLAAAGQETGLRGTVRITASTVVAHYLLPPILARIRAAEPEIELELHPSDTTENLLFREADIAVRMYRPEQLDVITRHVGEIGIGLYAAQSYLDRRGTPTTVEELQQHDWVGFDRSELMLRALRRMGWQVDRGFFRTRCDDQATYWQLVAAGCGIGGGQHHIGRSTPGVVRLMPELPIPSLPMWLTAAEALRQTPRLRRVWDLLAEGLRAAVSEPSETGAKA
ncbi:LysR family transcriptional regulator [Acidimangrovimonas pyrenivorans]|uniref:LysR family transcriptional regulator n=1 Tax=Acidimangrovimonas pyrenivorans TaxID=2030798 RepID=A0ABV7AKY1_9RHOB